MYLTTTIGVAVTLYCANVLADDTVAFPLIIPLTARAVPRGSLVSRKLSNTVTLPLKDYFNGTDLQ